MPLKFLILDPGKEISNLLVPYVQFTLCTLGTIFWKPKNYTLQRKLDSIGLVEQVTFICLN